MENALRMIRKKREFFSAVENKIAEYILQSPEKVIYMTVALLAKQAGVSEGSIINFANALGFKGFSGLKLNIAQNLPDQKKIISEQASEQDAPKAVLEKLSQEIAEAFRMTAAAADNEALEKAANLISEKKRIEIYGIGSSSMIAEDAYYRFMRQKIPAYAVTDAHIASVSASMLDRDALVIAISHSGRTVETLRAAEIARSHGAAVIALTSFADSPLARCCDVCLLSSSHETDSFKEALASRYSQLLILDTLLRYISLKDIGGTVANLENVSEIIGEHRM